MEPIRDFSRLTATDHVINRMKERNIGAHEVRKAVEEGEVYDGETPTTIKYRLEIPGVDLVAAVDIPKEKVVTVYYDDDQGAKGGRL